MRIQEIVLKENISSRVIDNVNGLGQVPKNQDVDYFGLRVSMRPSIFLKLSAELARPQAENIEYMEDHLSDGGKIGAPFLSLEVPSSWREGDISGRVRVSDHEGRHRMIAFMNVFGDELIEVHLFPLQMRSRHITTEMVQQMQHGMESQDGNLVKHYPLFFTEGQI